MFLSIWSSLKPILISQSVACKIFPQTSQIKIRWKLTSSFLGRFRIDQRSCSRLHQDIPQVAGTPLR
jgi:hypothetical protein